jgi:hypothetical protein
MSTWLQEHPCTFCLCSFKACLVAGGHLTDPNNTYSKYFIVVSLHSMQTAIPAGVLNNLFIMVGDIAFAYLEAFTLEKVCSMNMFLSMLMPLCSLARNHNSSWIFSSMTMVSN